MRTRRDTCAEDALPDLRARLVSLFGVVRPSTHRLDPMAQLVKAFLSARTDDENAWMAFVRLSGAVGAWSDLARMTASEVEPLISPVTWAESKARQLPLLARVIEARGLGFDLSFLAGRSVDQARQWLRDLPGVSCESAAATLCFSSLAMRDLVVDQHVHRVARRLGLVARNISPDETHEALLAHVPAAWGADDLFELHGLLRRVGQGTCLPTDPDCATCPLSQRCPKIEAAHAATVLRFRSKGDAGPSR